MSVAKIPAGSSKEQVNQMLQSLLEDRFKLIFHSATKELPLYELVTLARDGEDRPSARTAFQLYRRPARHAHDVQRRPSSYRRQRPIHD
jgi:uncharacterized protein (TIGR03435 family)